MFERGYPNHYYRKYLGVGSFMGVLIIKVPKTKGMIGSFICEKPCGNRELIMHRWGPTAISQLITVVISLFQKN